MPFSTEEFHSGPAPGSHEDGSLGQRAYQALRQALRDGLFQAGRNYSEQEFAELLGVSRTPVREALKALERDGVVETERHRGYRLREFSIAEIEEIVSLRYALERISVRTLVMTGSNGDVNALADILRRQDSDTRGQLIFALDEEFHLSIAALAGLHRTRDVLAGLRSAIAAVSAGCTIPLEATSRRVGEHHAIFDAIAARDSPEAIRLMDRHISGATSELLAATRDKLAIKPLRAASPS